MVHFDDVRVEEGRPLGVGVQMVTPEYFETFGIRMLQGRALNDRDGMSAQRVAVVNERFVRLFLNGQDPVGQRVAMDESGCCMVGLPHSPCY